MNKNIGLVPEKNLGTVQKEIKLEKISFGMLTGLHCMPVHKRFQKTLLFVHGICNTAEIFESTMLDAASLGYESYAVTLRGHGDSYPVENLGQVTKDDYVEDVATALRHIHEQVIIIGWSLGYDIGAIVAGQNPSKVAGFVGWTGAPDHDTPVGWRVLLKMLKPRYLLPTLLGKPVSLDKADVRDIMFNGIPEQELEKYFSKMVPESGKVIKSLLFGRDKLPKLEHALAFGAFNDKLTPDQRAMAARIGARFEEIPGCHMIMLNKGYKTLVSIMDGWLRETFPFAYDRPWPSL